MQSESDTVYCQSNAILVALLTVTPTRDDSKYLIYYFNIHFTQSQSKFMSSRMGDLLLQYSRYCILCVFTLQYVKYLSTLEFTFFLAIFVH